MDTDMQTMTNVADISMDASQCNAPASVELSATILFERLLSSEFDSVVVANSMELIPYLGKIVQAMSAGEYLSMSELGQLLTRLQIVRPKNTKLINLFKTPPLSNLVSVGVARKDKKTIQYSIVKKVSQIEIKVKNGQVCSCPSVVISPNRAVSYDIGSYQHQLTEYITNDRKNNGKYQVEFAKRRNPVEAGLRYLIIMMRRRSHEQQAGVPNSGTAIVEGDEQTSSPNHAIQTSPERLEEYCMKLTWREKIALIHDNWEEFKEILRCTSQERRMFKYYGDIIADLRCDAHALPILRREVDSFRGAIAWFEEKLGMNEKRAGA